MSIVDKQVHRAAFLARLLRISNEIADLQREIDVGYQHRPVPPVTTLKLMAEADTHLHLARVELEDAADRIRSMP